MRSAQTLRFVVAALAALVVVLWLGAGLRIPRLSPEDLTEMIHQELGLHPSATEVAAFLDRHEFERTEYHPSERRLNAMVRDTCYGLFIQCDILLKFEFDEDGKLVLISFDESFTSG